MSLENDGSDNPKSKSERKPFNRRKFLSQSILTISGISLASGIGAANGNSASVSGFNPNFDPENPTEVKEAVRFLHNLDERRDGQGAINALNDAQREAVVKVMRDVKLVESEPEFTTASTGSSYRSHTSRLKDGSGSTVAQFKHSIEWRWADNNITYYNPSGIGTAPSMWWYYRGLSTDEENFSEDRSVATKIGEFENCFSQYGCFNQVNMGSTMRVYPGGGWNYTAYSDV